MQQILFAKLYPYRILSLRLMPSTSYIRNSLRWSCIWYGDYVWVNFTISFTSYISEWWMSFCSFSTHFSAFWIQCSMHIQHYTPKNPYTKKSSCLTIRNSFILWFFGFFSLLTLYPLKVAGQASEHHTRFLLLFLLRNFSAKHVQCLCSHFESKDLFLWLG